MIFKKLHWKCFLTFRYITLTQLSAFVNTLIVWFVVKKYDLITSSGGLFEPCTSTRAQRSWNIAWNIQSFGQDLSLSVQLLQARKKGQLFCNALCFKNSEMCLFLIKVEWPTGSWNVVAMMYQGRLLKFHALASVQVLIQNF